jgi:IclR family acetate operon transcriptional repressor
MEAAVASPRGRSPVARAFHVLGWMVGQPRDRWALGVIASGVEMHPSTVHRALATLEAEGLVAQDGESGEYGLGLEFMRLAWAASSRESLAGIAMPALRELAEASEETVTLGVYDGARRQMMFIATIESPHEVRGVRPLHRWMPIYGGATGRAILAWLPEPERRAITSGPLPALARGTITDGEQLERNLAEVRSKGYAISASERVAGGVGIGAPILTADRHVAGVVGITLPEQRFDPASEPHLARLVMTAAETVSQNVGGRP